jgi:hypothetical protein
MEFSITEQLATLILVKEFITIANLHKEVEMMLQKSGYSNKEFVCTKERWSDKRGSE